MKVLTGEIFIKKEKLEECGIFHPIKLDYYKEINNLDEKTNLNKAKYGILIVKTDYLDNDLKIEEKEINNLTNDEYTANRILKIFKDNQVTPINSEEILLDLVKQRFFFES